MNLFNRKNKIPSSFVNENDIVMDQTKITPVMDEPLDNFNFSEAMNTNKHEKQDLQTTKEIPAQVMSMPSTDEKVKVLTPMSYLTTADIAQLLTTLRKIVVDFGKLSETERQRAIDFLSGVAYGLHGRVDKVGPHIYSFNVDNRISFVKK